jgi:glycosyltransferase involved in cell wall biosynthesis
VQRVLFVAAMGGLGGPVRRLATLLTNLDGVVKVLVKPRSRHLDPGLIASGALDEHIPISRSAQRDHVGALLIAAAVLRRAMRRRDPIDVIHANGLVEFALCWPAALLTGLPVVTWVGNYEPPRIVKRIHPLLRSVARRTSWNAVSSFAADVIVDTGLARREDVTVVTNIIDPDDVAPRTEPVSREDAPVTVGYLQVARWEKGFDLLAPVVEALADLDGRLRFLVWATPNDQPGWDELRSCPAGMVELRPRTPTVGDIYQACDVVFSPSRRESFNRVVAEALTTGTPVVASDLSPVVEVLGDGGLVFASGDVQAAAAQLRKLVVDPGLRQRLGHAGAHRSEAWRPGPVAQTFHEQYARAASGRGLRRAKR